MEDLYPILGFIAAIAYLGFHFGGPLILKRRLENVKTQPSEELKDLLSNSRNSIYFMIAANTLLERGENLSFAFPMFLDETLSGVPARAIIGKNCLKSFFPEIVKDIDLDKTFLSRDAKSKLMKLKEQVDTTITTPFARTR